MPSMHVSFSSTLELELKLKSEKEKFDAIFHGAESALVLFEGNDFILTMFNKKYQDIYHQERIVLGKPLLEVVPELKDSNFPQILQQVYETGNYYTSHEGLAQIYNPILGIMEDRYFDTTFSRVSYGEKTTYHILATPREVTSRVLTRKKLEESLRELEQERDLRERFVSALTHDLRTPLAVVKSCSEFLKMEAGDPSNVLEMAKRISAGVDRADRMIRDLLDANRISAGEGTPITVEECRLDLIIAIVVDDLKELHGSRFKIINNVGEIYGYWDSFALHRLIDNLASNAIKYGSPYTPITIELKKNSSNIEIAIHNEGNPIPPEEQKHLFNQYRRTKAALKSGEVGWGMGLAIVKSLAEAHNGSVRVESKAESGTTFIVTLPFDSLKKNI